MTVKKRDEVTLSFRRHLEAVAQDKDPAAAFRAGLVAAVLEDHPNADPKAVEEAISWAGG